MTDAVVTLAALEVVETAPGEAVATVAAAEVAHSGEPAAQPTLVALEAANTGAPLAAPTVVGVEIWRSIRDAPFPIFPVRLFNPPSLSVRLRDGAVVGPLTPADERAAEAFDAGGRWLVGFGETPLRGREQLLAWRMLSAAADWGATNVIVPLGDRRHQPLAPASYDGDDPFGLEVWGDPFDWQPDQVEAAFAETTLHQATEILVDYDGPLELVGGEHFSVLGRHWGWRLYRIVRVLEQGDGQARLEIRPPLREWARAGERLNFDSPRCTMRIDGPIEPMLEQLRFGTGAVRFVETWSITP